MNNKKLLLDSSKTVLLQDTIQNILSSTQKHRKGIDMRLYQVPGATAEDTQTITTFLSCSSKRGDYNESEIKCNKIDNIISDVLDRILISDRVRSCTDYYRTNSRTPDFMDITSNEWMEGMDGKSIT